MKFEDYLKQDAAIEHEFADESIISNLHPNLPKKLYTCDL